MVIRDCSVIGVFMIISGKSFRHTLEQYKDLATERI